MRDSQLIKPSSFHFLRRQKRGETSRRFERLNQFFEETFGTVCSYPQNVEMIQKEDGIKIVTVYFPESRGYQCAYRLAM